MSFTTQVFFPFLFIYLALSALVTQKQWLWLVAVASGVFYAYWDWRFLFLLYYVALVTWYCGKRIAAATAEREKHLFVIVSVVSCLLVLGIFKYFNFFTDSFLRMASEFGVPFHPLFVDVILPVGISFYTFHGISYTIDIYRGKLAKPAGLLSVAVYLSFFPQLVAGPIVRAHHFLPQIDRGPVFQLRKASTGILLIAWGYFLKVALADSIGVVIDHKFANITGSSSGDLLFSIFAYSFQIYGDFAGYSLVAIGLAKLQGFDFPANFLVPYSSKSFSEFWRRWHISLSSFLRDYLYIPLGGNRHGKLMEYRNLFLTMFLGGLWHGASYNFLIWGSLHGIYLAAQRLTRDVRLPVFSGLVGGIKKRMPGVLITSAKLATVFALVLFAWIFFRIKDLPDAIDFIARIISLQGIAVLSTKFAVVKISLLIAITLSVDTIFLNRRRVIWLRRRPLAIAASVAALCCLIELLGNFGGGAFIYFQF